MLRGAARRRCPQGAAVSRAVASAASAAGWAQTPPWGGQAAWIQLHSPCFQDFLNDERDRNETEAPTLKLYVLIVHSLLHIDRSINVMDLVGGSCDSRRVWIEFALGSCVVCEPSICCCMTILCCCMTIWLLRTIDLLLYDDLDR